MMDVTQAGALIAMQCKKWEHGTLGLLIQCPPTLMEWREIMSWFQEYVKSWTFCPRRDLWRTPVLPFDRLTKMGFGIHSGSQRLSSSFRPKITCRWELLQFLSPSWHKFLRALPLEKKHRFSFIFQIFIFLSFKKQLQICDIENIYFGEVQSNRVFSYDLHFGTAHGPPGEF